MIGSAGKVTVPTPGTPVSAMTNMPGGATGKPVSAHAVMFQALSTNTGKIYIGTNAMVVATLAATFAVLPAPTSSQIPSFSVAHTIAPNGLSLGTFWIDAEIGDDGVLITYLQT